MTIMLIGNKSDMEHRRAVALEEGQQFAHEHQLIFLETSAKSGSFVDTAFLMLANDIKEKMSQSSQDIILPVA